MYGKGENLVDNLHSTAKIYEQAGVPGTSSNITVSLIAELPRVSAARPSTRPWGDEDICNRHWWWQQQPSGVWPKPTSARRCQVLPHWQDHRRHLPWPTNRCKYKTYSSHLCEFVSDTKNTSFVFLNEISILYMKAWTILCIVPLFSTRLTSRLLFDFCSNDGRYIHVL